MVLPAPDGPTSAVMVPGLAVKVSPFRTTPLSTVSGFATDSSEESEISSAFGYAKETFLNSTAKSLPTNSLAFGRSCTMGAKSKTSKIRSNETKAVITSMRTFESAVSGP